MNEYDQIIIGGGCSGLSLALHIGKKEPQKKILVLENRPIYQHDRTWSFWNVDPHPFENQIQHTWNQWQVQHQGRLLTLTSDDYCYCSIPSDCFYQTAMEEINLLQNVTLFMDSQVIRIDECASHVTVETNKGFYRCAKVFDSRPEKTTNSLYQHFLGWQILSEHPLFDPLTVRLMDFDVDQSKGLHFMYLLPFSSHEALVESTFISPNIHDEHVYEKAISCYLKERYKTSSYQILRKERGVIPLKTLKTKEKSCKIVPIGAKAGWTRASTGYAFLPIQKAIQNLAYDQLKQKSIDIDFYLDQIFLAFIYNDPQSAPKVFFDLFRENSPDQLVRFLTGHWSILDLLHVLISMPKIAMITHALQLMIKEKK